MAKINLTPDELFQLHLNNFREKFIPERYNQIKLLNEVNNPEIDHFISISNRTDGKTFNYVHALLDIAITYGVGLSFFSRNMYLRVSYQVLIEEILDTFDTYKRNDFNFIRQHHYITVKYKSKDIAIISDLNSASDLKQFSSYLRNFPIMIFDEFLVLEGDYLHDEWDKIKTIYQSIDREQKKHPLIHSPKIFYFGNAMNFESPVLHGMKILSILEKHPINTAKIYDYEFKVMLEMNRNDNANEVRNTRAFGNSVDAMATGEFKTNNYKIADDVDRNAIRKNPRFIYVKLKEDYLKIWFNRNSLLTILSIESDINDEDYHYNLLLKDNRKNSIFLSEKYFSDNHIKRINKGAYLFDNNYSKNQITTDFQGLDTLRLNKIMREFLRKDSEQLEEVSKEKQYEENYIEQTKIGIFNKFWG